MTVEVYYELEAPELPPEAARRALEEALRYGGREAEGVELVFVSDERLAELHATFLDDPSPTDVMAFDLSDELGGTDAEVYVSVERARAVSAERGDSVQRELSLYVVHGGLHLCGYDDGEPKARAEMRRAERDVLTRLGFEVERDDDAHDAH